MKQKVIWTALIAGMVLSAAACGKPESKDASSIMPETEILGVSEEETEVRPDLPEDYMTQEEAEDDSWKQEPEVDLTGYYQMYYAGTEEKTGSYVEIDADHNYTEIQKYEYGYMQGENKGTMISLTLQGVEEGMTEPVMAYVTATEEGAVLDYNIYDDVEPSDELVRTLVHKDGENALADCQPFDGTYVMEEYGASVIYEFREDGTMLSRRTELYEARGNVFLMGEVKMAFEKTDEKLTILTVDQEPVYDLIPCEKQEL